VGKDFRQGPLGAILAAGHHSAHSACPPLSYNDSQKMCGHLAQAWCVLSRSLAERDAKRAQVLLDLSEGPESRELMYREMVGYWEVT
jgi:hypothetical protein